MAKILFKMSGSIACFKACAAISTLVKQGHEVQTIITDDVLNFVGKSTLEGLTGKKVLHHLHEEGNMMSHIHLNSWADISVLCPASANTLAKIKNGESSNLVLSLALARETQKPYLIFPAMNPKMWDSAITQSNVRALKKYGFSFFLGAEGPVACGDYGRGRLLEPDQICETINQVLAPKVKKRILITAGGTTENLDAVRSISNSSTGKTGAFLAQQLLQNNEITFLGSKEACNELQRSMSIDLNSIINLNVMTYVSYSDLKQLMTENLKTQNFDAIIHCAAVSDFSPEKIMIGNESYTCPVQEKLPTNENMQVHLKKNPKLIESIRKDSKNSKIKIIGFKLLKNRNDHAVKENIEKVLNHSDHVVLNFLDEIHDGLHKFEVHSKAQATMSGETKKDMAEVLSRIIFDDSNKVVAEDYFV